MVYQSLRKTYLVDSGNLRLTLPLGKSAPRLPLRMIAMLFARIDGAEVPNQVESESLRQEILGHLIDLIGWR